MRTRRQKFAHSFVAITGKYDVKFLQFNSSQKLPNGLECLMLDVLQTNRRKLHANPGVIPSFFFFCKFQTPCVLAMCKGSRDFESRYHLLSILPLQIPCVLASCKDRAVESWYLSSCFFLPLHLRVCSSKFLV